MPVMMPTRTKPFVSSPPPCLRRRSRRSMSQYRLAAFPSPSRATCRHSRCNKSSTRLQRTAPPEMLPRLLLRATRATHQHRCQSRNPLGGHPPCVLASHLPSHLLRRNVRGCRRVLVLPLCAHRQFHPFRRHRLLWRTLQHHLRRRCHLHKRRHRRQLRRPRPQRQRRPHLPRRLRHLRRHRRQDKRPLGRAGSRDPSSSRSCGKRCPRTG